LSFCKVFSCCDWSGKRMSLSLFLGVLPMVGVARELGLRRAIVPAGDAEKAALDVCLAPAGLYRGRCRVPCQH